MKVQFDCVNRLHNTLICSEKIRDHRSKSKSMYVTEHISKIIDVREYARKLFELENPHPYPHSSPR